MVIDVEQSADAGVRFIRTPEYGWFEEFAQTCQQYRYIGVCHGPAGVGKTWAARYFSRWDITTQLVGEAYQQLMLPAGRRPQLDVRGVYYTVPVSNTPRLLREELTLHFDLFHEGSRLTGRFPEGAAPLVPSLLLIDEADRLSINSLEYLRDLYDQHQFGLVLIGMPDLEKRLRRYAQLYSRVGFSHSFRPLTAGDLKTLMTVPVHDGRPALLHPPFADEETLGAVIRTSRGNLRLLVRLLDQIERLVALNELSEVTGPVVVAATGLLTIGTPD